MDYNTENCGRKGICYVIRKAYNAILGVPKDFSESWDNYVENVTSAGLEKYI